MCRSTWKNYLVNMFITLFFMILPIKPCQFGGRKMIIALYNLQKNKVSFEYASWQKHDC